MRIRTIIVALQIIFAATAGAITATASGSPQLHSAIQSAPLVFEPNHGKERPGVKFFSRAGNYTLALMAGRVTLRPAEDQKQPVVIQFVGSNSSAKLEGMNLLSSKTHYLTDPNPRKWQRNVPNYARAQYRNLYPGIDAVFYGDGGHVEYDFVLAPGADPKVLRLRVSGARIEIGTDGDLLLHTAAGEFRQRKPVVYQESNGRRVPIAGAYAIDHGEITFKIAPYDRSRALVIDPVLSYAAALVHNGGPASVAVDGSGYVYVAASNTVMKMSISGSGTATVAYSTYLGALNITGIATDGAGNTYLTGGSGGEQAVPIVNGFQPNCSLTQGGTCIFLVKLSADGSSILYSTYTVANPGVVQRPSVAADSNGNAYLAASTGNFYATKNAYQSTVRGISDIFIVKVDTNQSGNASLIYSTFFGGSGADVAQAVAADAYGSVYVTGETRSSDFPLRAPLQSAYGEVFVVKLDAAGVLIYSTYLGGTGSGYGIAVDANSNIYLSGSAGADFPIRNGFQTSSGGGEDAFIAKISADGSSLLYSTFLGGSRRDIAAGIAVDPIGGVYLGGATFSPDFPELNPLHGVGALKTSDGGATWSVPGVGLPFSNWTIAIDPQQPTRLYTGGDKGVFKSADAARTWTGTSVGFTTRALAFERTATPSIVYAATVGGVFRSSDGGDTWSSRNAGLASLDIGNIIVVPGQTPQVWAYTRAGLYKSTDGANSWVLASSHVTDFVFEGFRVFGGPFRPGIAYDPNMTSTMYMANDQGFISKSSDGGSTWNTLTAGPFVAGTFTAALIAVNSSIVYATISTHLWDTYMIKSGDGGATWSMCAFMAAEGIAFDQATPTTIYVADSMGAVAGKSTDGCATWSGINEGRVFRDVAIDPDAGTQLYFATHANPPAGCGANCDVNPIAFVAKVDPTKSGASSLIYSSYYGATGGTTAYGIAVDSSGNAFVGGSVHGVGGSVHADVTKADGTLTLTPAGTALLFKVGGLVVTSAANPTAQSGSVTATFSSVTTAGTTSINTIDPATAGQAPGQFAISNIAAYDISTTASVSGPIVSCFVVSSVNDSTTFANLRILHSELSGSMYQLVDRTILAPNFPAPNFETRTICAQTNSLSPFYVARVGQKLVPLFDQTKAYKGGTLPIKVQLVSAAGVNLSTSALPLTIRSIRLLGNATLASTAASGNANPDAAFRYDATLGGYVYNLSLKNYPPGRYGMSVFAGGDRDFFYTVEFQVQ